MSDRERRPCTQAVNDITAINFSGNLTPRIWYRCPLLKYPSGKTYLYAITLLADICYWYTAGEESENGRVVFRYRRFYGEMLEKKYEEWAEEFGMSKREVQDAIAHLDRVGLIRRHVKKPEIRIFIEPVAEKIFEITHPNARRLTLERESKHGRTLDDARQDEQPFTAKRERTNTKSTPKSYSKTTTTDASLLVDEDIKIITEARRKAWTAYAVTQPSIKNVAAFVNAKLKTNEIPPAPAAPEQIQVARTPDSEIWHPEPKIKNPNTSRHIAELTRGLAAAKDMNAH